MGNLLYQVEKHGKKERVNLAAVPKAEVKGSLPEPMLIALADKDHLILDPLAAHPTVTVVSCKTVDTHQIKLELISKANLPLVKRINLLVQRFCRVLVLEVPPAGMACGRLHVLQRWKIHCWEQMCLAASR